MYRRATSPSLPMQTFVLHTLPCPTSIFLTQLMRWPLTKADDHSIACALTEEGPARKKGVRPAHARTILKEEGKPLGDGVTAHEKVMLWSSEALACPGTYPSYWCRPNRLGVSGWTGMTAAASHALSPADMHACTSVMPPSTALHRHTSASMAMAETPDGRVALAL